MNKLEYDTRHWPIVYNNTLVYTLKQVSLVKHLIVKICRFDSLLQELDPLPELIKKESLTENELEEAKRVSSHTHTPTVCMLQLSGLFVAISVHSCV